MSELANQLQSLKEQSNIGKRGTLAGDQVLSVFGPSIGNAVSTPLSPISTLRWGDVVEEGIETNRFEGAQDSLPLTRIRGLSQPSLEGSKLDSDIVMTNLEGLDLSQGTTSSCLDALGLQDVEVLLVDEVDRGQSSREDRGGRGHGAHRGSRGRGGRGNMSNFVDGRRPFGAVPQGPTKTWADVANMPSRSPVKLRYIPSPLSDNPNLVELPPRKEDLGKWESCFVGYFLDKKLPYNYVKNSVSNQWKNLGLSEVLANGEGFMFFCFDNVDSCERVLEGGPWYVGNQLLLLKRWKRMMKLTKEYMSQIPVWVKLFHVPMEYWDFEGLSRIPSLIGTPLFMDNLTSSGTRISFARVCVEVNVESTLPQSFFVKCEEEVVEIRVEYQGLPTKCEHCKVFGHNTKNCITNQVAQLVQMQKQSENEKDGGWQTVKAKGKKKMSELEGNGSASAPSQQDPPILQESREQPVLSSHSAPITAQPQQDPPPRESLIPGVNEEVPLKALHDEILGLAQVLSPKASQIIEEVKREVMAAKSPMVSMGTDIQEKE
ncbi:uncharacterized protein LOC114279476 [Camellia sinensis]|uniref:uncharacterized protein LOC114279476 n=1 Tax=Camellia sinensis TaxID=4442 RepID=UPI001035C30F|nr:uncharacterized protein LOC114279476 [Camellia sinensis]